jgi:hypothetical protein
VRFRNIEERQDADTSRLDAGAPEQLKVDEAGRTGIHHGGDTMLHAAVRIDAEGAAFVPVAM